MFINCVPSNESVEVVVDVDEVLVDVLGLVSVFLQAILNSRIENVSNSKGLFT